MHDATFAWDGKNFSGTLNVTSYVSSGRSNLFLFLTSTSIVSSQLVSMQHYRFLFCEIKLFIVLLFVTHIFLSVAVATAADTPAWFAWLAGLPHSHTALQSHRNKLIYFRCWCSKCKSSKNYRIYSGKVLRIAKNKKKHVDFSSCRIAITMELFKLPHLPTQTKIYMFTYHFTGKNKHELSEPFVCSTFP